MYRTAETWGNLPNLMDSGLCISHKTNEILVRESLKFKNVCYPNKKKTIHHKRNKNKN